VASLWKTLSRRKVLECGKFLTVEDHTVELPDGRVVTGWPWLITPDYVNIIPVLEDGRLLFFRQTKYGIEGESLAAVGGFVEPGEAPLDAAKRELREETGYAAEEWTPLGQYRVDSNRGGGTANFFLARSVRLIGKTESDDLEEQRPGC